MHDVDLAAIRARHAELRALLHEMADGLANANWGIVANAARWADSLVEHADAGDVPALLALVDEQAARIADAERRLEEANARTAERCKQLMAARRDVEQLAAERDHWQGVATGCGACPVDGCDGLLLHLSAADGRSFVRLSCGHAPEATARTDEAATTDEFRVEFRLDRGPADRWHRSATRYPDLNAAMDRVRDSQKRYPEPVFRIWRVAKSEAVVWQSPVPVPPSVWAVVDEVHVTSDAQLAEVVERAGGEKPPESPAEPDPQPTP